jgi:hypothetical protein
MFDSRCLIPEVLPVRRRETRLHGLFPDERFSTFTLRYSTA